MAEKANWCSIILPMYVLKKQIITGKQYSSAAVRTVVRTEECSSGEGGTPSTSGWPILWKKKKRFISRRTKKDSHVRNGPPTHHGRRSAPYTHPPTKPLLHLYYTQQYGSAAVHTAVHLVRGEQLVGRFLRTLYETGNKRGEFHFLTILDHLGERASRHPPPTHHPPTTHPSPTIHPRTYPVLQYSNEAVRRAIHLTGEQQPIRWLQCSRAGRDSQLFTIPRHAGGQASRPREGDFHAPP